MSTFLAKASSFQVESAAQSHPLLSNSSTTFSPRDTHHPSFLLPGIITLLMASPANLSTSSYSSKDELANLSLDTPCGDPLPRPSSSLIFSVIILSSELHLQIDANSIPSLVWSHSNVYSSRNDLFELLSNSVEAPVPCTTREAILHLAPNLKPGSHEDSLSLKVNTQ